MAAPTCARLDLCGLSGAITRPALYDDDTSFETPRAQQRLSRTIELAPEGFDVAERVPSPLQQKPKGTRRNHREQDVVGVCAVLYGPTHGRGDDRLHRGKRRRHPQQLRGQNFAA